MEMKVIQCKEHGGSFSIPRRRGRPPGACTTENPCDMNKKRVNRVVTKANTPTAAEKRASASHSRGNTRVAPTKGGKLAQSLKGVVHTEPAKKATRTRPGAGPVTVQHNPSVVLAKRAKDVLEPQGWNLKGRSWFDEDESAWAEVTGSRGEEILRIVWQEGKFHSQDYSLWDSEKTPGQNGKPKTRLPFDPDEMSDTDLARELSGRKVTWWNKTGSSTETAIIGDKLKIEHAYTGGNETSRQVHFVDATPNHAAFRAFNVDALMRVK